MEKATKTCQNCKREFVIEPDDFGFYQKINVPPPSWCARCRMTRRMAWMGYRILYKRKCDYSGDDVITFYHPELPYKIYRQDIWWSDAWDPKSYGRTYDFSRPFFVQFDELLKSVPVPSLHTEHTSLVNSEYCNAAAKIKNCYLCFRTDRSENCAYTNAVSLLRDCLDAIYSTECELSYDIVNNQNCYRSFYCRDCESSQDIYFSQDLIGCSYCIGCINLRNKNYYLFNKPCSKEEFEKTLSELDLGSYQNIEALKKRVAKFFLQFPRKAFHGRKNVNVAGDYIFNSKNVHDSYMVDTAENVKYSQFLKAPSADTYDTTILGLNVEWAYESVWTGLSVNNVKFSFWTYHAHHLEYSFGCHGSEYLFGCVGVRNGSYCIFNKQHSKADYFEMVENVKKHMQETPYIDRLGRAYCYGDFFPVEISPWAYNESKAYEFFPLIKEEAIKQGFRWHNPVKSEYRPSITTISDHIKGIPDEIVNAILQCVSCDKNYRIIQSELLFYRKLNIPIPRHCPLCRERARIRPLNPIAIYNRKCAKCKKDIQTSYAPDRPEIVYCEECYQQEVV